MPAAVLQKISVSEDPHFPAMAFLIGRIPDLELPSDRAAALQKQHPLHQEVLATCFPGVGTQIPFAFADQVHGADIASVSSLFPGRHLFPQVDGLITADKEVILGIYVADCAPVWIVDKKGRAGALVHSGKRGTEAAIVPRAIARFETEFQIPAADLMVTLGPCIRPPCYEVDFAKTIREQAAAAGVLHIYDEKICTACHPDAYYSYRREQGKTGHMLACLRLNATP